MEGASRPTTSLIPVPVPTPRPPHSPMSSSLSSPQFSLQSPSRVSSTFTISSPPASPGNQSSTPNSSKSIFRFRNLLPFGSKSQSPNTTITPKSRTSSLGRASFGERSKSFTDRKVTEPSRLEYTPVVVITAPPSKSKGRDFLLPELHQEPNFGQIFSLESPLSLTADRDLPPLPGSPCPPPGDLSTIIESETSGVSISKHIPPLNVSQDVEDLKRDDFRGKSPSADSTDTFDLSTSKLAEEVRKAMSAEDGKADWLGGVVVEDLPNAQGAKLAKDLVHDVSFNLSALDPELAALLSPNRLTRADPTIPLANKLRSSPNRVSHEKQASPNRVSYESQSSSPSRFTHERQLSPPFSGPASPIVSESLPSARPSRELTSRQPFSFQSRLSLSASTSSRSPSAAAIASRSRKSDRSPTPSDSIAFSPGGARPSPIISAQRPPLPPGVVDEHGFLQRTDGPESYVRRSTSRSGTPARMSTLQHPLNSRPLRHLISPTNHWEAESVSPSSRASSSLGITTSRRAFGSRPSMDSEVRSSFELDRTSPFRTRNRSMSDSRASPPVSVSTYRSNSTAAAFQATSLPGPKATRLFKAGRSPERDFRQMAPSRSGYSEVSRSSSSWGRNRTGTVSESPISTSTAPTTVSASSLQNQEIEMQILKDKHQMETDALLAALSDSQNMNKILRDENAGLRDKIQDLEDRHMDMMDQFRRLPPEPPSITQYPSQDRITRPGSVEPLYRRNKPARAQPLFTASGTLDKEGLYRSASLSLRKRNSVSLDPSSFLDSSTSRRSIRQRSSISSSVFQAPPSNMSMLNDDDGIPQHAAGFSVDSPSPPPSPTLVFTKLQPHTVPYGQSASSPLVNVSPTTANFSSILDSPTSLRLRSEHEDHLRDMASLDLRADFDEN